METKKLTLILFLLSLIGFGISYYFIRIYDCGTSVFCFNFTTKMFAAYYSMPALALIFLLLFLAPQAFPTWKTFAKWFIPLATLLLILYPEPGAGDLFSPFPKQVFQWVSIAYVVISLGIIGWSIAKGKTTAPTKR